MDLRVSLGVALSVVVAVDARGFHGGTFHAAGAEASLRFVVEEHSRNQVDDRLRIVHQRFVVDQDRGDTSLTAASYKLSTPSIFFL